MRWSCYHIISCNRPTCSSVILRVDNTDIEILLPIRIIQEEFFLYSDNTTNITSTINTHRAAQPLPDKWRPMLVCMMKGYAPMLRYHNQLHQQLGHEMKPLFPSASSLAIPSQSCALFNTQGTAQAQKCFCAAKHPRRNARTVLAIILTTNPLNSDRLMILNLARPSRSRRNSGRIPF